ncbi:hypothetical protein ONS96_001976 [Cadophora gregata f. sp. sojae]|nr:hypothetical protein ONS96_001976 [Cadophora gregata f. sp. sojae]
MPNFITFIGPSWPVENGSVMGPLNYVGDYAIKFIKKMQGEAIRSIAPKQDITDAFNAHTQSSSSTRSGQVTVELGSETTKPEKSMQCSQAARFTTVRHNPWAYLGFGFTYEDMNKTKEGVDLTPYLSEEAIDPKWMEEVIKTGALVADREVQMPQPANQ